MGDAMTKSGNKNVISKDCHKKVIKKNPYEESVSFNFVQRRSKGLWSVDQMVSGRSTIAPLNGRPEDLIKTDHRTVKEKS